MKAFERAIIYTGLAAAIAMAAGWPGVGDRARAAEFGWPASSAADMKVASFDVLIVLERMFLSDKYRAERDAEAAKLQPMRDQLLGMQTRLQQLDQNSEEFKAQIPTFEKIRGDLQQAEQRVVAFQASQVSRAYVEVAAAAKKAAGELGYTHVVASRPVGAEFRGQNVESVVQEVLQRVLIVGPEGQDITESVLKELKIEAPTPAIAVPVEEGPKTATPK
mgnify:CR=1 FL=1